jgi:hypothetical protein
MLKLALATALVATVFVRPASACDNGVQWTVDDYVPLVVRAEKAIEAGRYSQARQLVSRWMPSQLDARVANIKMVIALRFGDGKITGDKLVAHFKARSEAKDGKDVRLRAYLAEAYIKAGKPDDARAILVELQQKDLMPDAYAYLALATLSSGSERYEYWKACRTRAAAKEICELPDATTQARR